MPDKVKMGIISLGGAGRAHLKRFQSNSKSEVLALYDLKDSSLHQALQQCPSSQIKLVTTDFEEFLRFNQIDAVSVCSPDYCHVYHIVESLKHGFHVICEKPLATTSEDCKRIIELAKSGEKKVTVHHQMRFVPVFQRAKELIDNNQIGEIFYIEASYYHNMRERASEFDKWRIDPKTSQNIVLGGACHPIDLMQWVTNDQIVEVFAYANHLAFKEYPDVDTVVAVLKFQSGIIGNMTMTIGCQRPQYNPLNIYGSKGTISNGLVFREDGEQDMIHIIQGRWNRLISKLIKHKTKMTSYPFNHYEHDVACIHLIDRFLESILNDAPIPITLEDSADTILVCQAVINSYLTGHPVLVQR